MYKGDIHKLLFLRFAVRNFAEPPAVPLPDADFPHPGFGIVAIRDNKLVFAVSLIYLFTKSFRLSALKSKLPLIDISGMDNDN